MTLSWFGAVVTFQVTFTELFIAATVIATSAYRFGWRSVALGSVLGAAGVAVLAAALQVAAYRIALHWLDWHGNAFPRPPLTRGDGVGVVSTASTMVCPTR